jgi:hypothetical protein
MRLALLPSVSVECILEHKHIWIYNMERAYDFMTFSDMALNTLFEGFLSPL